MDTKQIKELALEAKQEWIDANFGSKKQVGDWVKKKLDSGMSEVLMKVLGFDRDYSERHFRIDHCNHRSGNSVIGDYLQASCRMAVEKWAEANIGKLPDLETKTILELHDEYKKILREAVRSKMKIRVEQKAEQIAKELAEAV